MTEEQLVRDFGAIQELGGFRVKGFTVGGASSMHSGLELILDDDKLGLAYLTFRSEQFDDVLAAVKAKYPSTICVKSKLRTRAGVPYDQVTCRLKGATSVLSLTKYVADVDTSIELYVIHDITTARLASSRR